MQTLTTSTVPDVLPQKHTRPLPWKWLAAGAALVLAIIAAAAIVAAVVARDDTSPAPSSAVTRSASVAETQLGSDSGFVDPATAAKLDAAANLTHPVIRSTTAAEAPREAQAGAIQSTNAADLRILPGPR